MAMLKAEKRSELGTRKIRKLRATGKIPAIIYGHGKDNVPITLNEHEVALAILHGERLLEVDIAGTKENVLIKDVQYDTFGQDVLHLDLTRVSLDERVEVTVRVVLRGTPAGAADGGMLQQVVSDVNIECLVTAIPEEIRASVTEMDIGDTIVASDLPLPEGAKLLDEPDTLICSVIVVAEAEEAPAEEAEEAVTTEPEVIGEKTEQAEDQQASENK